MIKGLKKYKNHEPAGVTLPSIVSDGESSLEMMKRLVREGMDRLGYSEKKEYEKRMEKEVETLEELGFTDYALLNWKVLNFCRENDIVVGRGRGSSAGSLVLNCLGVTGIDAVKRHLYFERFVSKTRAKKAYNDDGEEFLVGSLLPDVDVDISFDRRDEVINFINEEFKGKTAKILTFNTFSSKLCIREATKYFTEKEDEADRVSSMIPKNSGVVASLVEAREQSEDFNKWASEHQEIFESALLMENLNKNTGVHPSGIAICAFPIESICPVQLTKDGELITGYSMNDVADLMVKFDLLGLRTLTVAKECCDLVGINLDDIDEDNPEIYSFLQDLHSPAGLFQISADTNYQVCQKVKPSNLSELSDVVALARPASLQFVDEYVSQKLINEPLGLHPKLDDILASTKNVMLMQEQTMRACHEVFGMSLEEAEELRRCVTGDTRFYSKTRGWIKIETLIKDGYKEDLFLVMNDQGVQEWKNISNIWSNGMKQIRYVEAQNGLTVKASQYHQFLTDSGWKARRRLSNKDYLVTPSRMLTGDRKQTVSNEMVIISAGMISEGYFVYGNCPTFTNYDKSIYNAFLDSSLKEFGDAVSPRKCGKVISLKLACHEKLLRHIKRGKSIDKDLPDWLFSQDDETIKKFISFYAACEFTVSGTEISVTSKSRKLIQKFQLLMLQLNYPTYINNKKNKEYGDYFVLYIPKEKEFFSRFLNDFSEYLQDYKIEKIKKAIQALPDENWNTYHFGIPKNIYESFLDQYPFTPHSIGLASGGFYNGELSSDKISRQKFSKLIEVSKDKKWKSLADSPICYQKIKDLEKDIREVEVFDFTVDEDTPFILANGLVIHNCIGKKKVEEIPKWEKKIYDAAEKNNVSKEAADYFWEVVQRGASYQFCAAHSFSYSTLASQTVFLKYKYPKEFFLAALKISEYDPEPLLQVAEIQEELSNFGLKLLPPSLYSSKIDFSLEENGIRYGLKSIKGISQKSLESLVEFRGNNFQHKYDVFLGAKEAGLNISTLVCLIKCGAMDDQLDGKSRGLLALEAQSFNLLTDREKRNIVKLKDRLGDSLLNVLVECKNSQTLGDDDKPIIKESRFQTFLGKYQKYKEQYNEFKENRKFSDWWHETTLLGFSYSCKLSECFENNFGVILGVKETKELPHRSRFSCAIQVTDFEKRVSSNQNKYMKIEGTDGDGSCEFLVMNGNFGEPLDEIEMMGGIKKKDVLVLTGSKSEDTMFVNQVRKPKTTQAEEILQEADVTT